MNEEQYHFVGVCGTAMGSLAAAMKARGFRVTGSDQAVYPPMSTFLEEQGVEVREGYAPEHVEGATVAVVGNAISRGNPEAEAILDGRLRYVSMPELLKEHFLRGKENLVVTGTHGKTTTTSLLAWMLEVAQLDPSFLIGGITRNFGRGCRLVDSAHCVLEGDEYDTAFFDKRSKFLHYLPWVLVVGNIEFDHADIYESLDEILLSFRRVLSVVPRAGMAFLNGDDANCRQVAEGAPGRVSWVGFGEDCDHRIEEVSYREGVSVFKLDGVVYELGMVGEFNVRNAAMALCAARFVGVEPAILQRALDSFEGVARRQEERGTVRGVSVVDDFAHHPTAIAQATRALRQKYPQRRIWVIFEPRSNTTRRKVFQDSLPVALAEADRVTLAAIPDVEKFALEERLDTEQLMGDLRATDTPASYQPGVEDIVEEVAREAQEGDVIAVLSNGGFGGIHQKLLDALAR